ncbi:unnamed protein product [Peniophora sp. CBMAI 1063]|nr:unnamed protein product [Peniophora sp. CBMAI 1063]
MAESAPDSLPTRFESVVGSLRSVANEQRRGKGKDCGKLVSRAPLAPSWVPIRDSGASPRRVWYRPLFTSTLLSPKQVPRSQFRRLAPSIISPPLPAALPASSGFSNRPAVGQSSKFFASFNTSTGSYRGIDSDVAANMPMYTH